MDNDMIELCIEGEKKSYPRGTRFLEIVKEYQKEGQDDIVLVMYQNRLREPPKPDSDDAESGT